MPHSSPPSYHGDEEIAAAEKELDAAAQKAGSLADRLHKARAKAAPAFAKQILATLAQLGMPETVFRVALTAAPRPRAHGSRDGVAFLFSANRNATPQSVERIASGGELSRVMLALKALLARRMQLPTVIFDEIDTGVSGRIADAMGEIIESLSATLQVVDITHLPQVASKGAAHFVVYKRDGRTGIRPPDGRGAHHRDRQDALRQPHHRCRHSPGTHSAGQITAHATTRRPERTFCPAHFMNSVY